jgi:hypothetical protein
VGARRSRSSDFQHPKHELRGNEIVATYGYLLAQFHAELLEYAEPLLIEMATDAHKSERRKAFYAQAAATRRAKAAEARAARESGQSAA